jgi:hypothetical protein
MIPSRSRRFTIADLMLLICAAALATIMTRDDVASIYLVYRAPEAQRLYELVEGPTKCVASALMLALIPIRLARPRPPWRRLARQPGFVACWAIAAVLALGLVEGLFRVAFQGGFKQWGGVWPFHALWELGVVFRGPFAVAAAWLALALAGRWSPEASWIDRLGRALGLAWVIWLPMTLIEPWLLLHLPAF